MNRRERQVRQALQTREQQVERIMREELGEKTQEARWRWWATPGKGPLFCFTTTPVEQGDKRGWASFVAREDAAGYIHFETDSLTLHRQRKQAKARAWNLYQGWRLARDMPMSWKTFA